jgi:hypothetical protein
MTFSLALDALMTILLGCMIYFAWQLTRQLGRFREHRSDMMLLVQQLNGAIAAAQASVAELRDNIDIRREGLEKTVRSAMELSDELQLMVEAGNSLASRLERAAGRSDGGSENNRSGSVISASSQKTEDGPSSPFSFSIHDREFDEGGGGSSSSSPDDDLFLSEAERELYRALSAAPRPSRLS